MALIHRTKEFDSFILDKKFLKEFLRIFNENNNKIETELEITVNSYNERTIYYNLEDFFNSRILPFEIESISIKLKPKNNKEKRKITTFHLNIDEDKPYYSLIGYDDGRLSTIQKQITNLFDEYKTIYHLYYKIIKNNQDLFPFLLSLSISIIIFKILKLLSSFKNDSILLFSFLSFLIILNYSKKIHNYFLPFIDYQIKERKREYIIKYIFFAIILGLIINLIWEGIKLFI